MKKLALLAATITLMGMTANCFAAAQATVLLNNFDSNNAIMFVSSAGGAAVAAPGSANISVQLLGGAAAGSLAPVIPTGGGNGIIPVAGAAAGGLAGFFDGGVGVVPGVAPNATATFQLVAFTGTDPSTGVKSATWTQPTGSWDNAAVPPAPPSGPSLQNPAGLTVGGAPPIPEPSTIALGLLGLGALLIRRRH